MNPTSTGTVRQNARQNIIHSLNNLPQEALAEVANYLDYIRFKFKKTSPASTPYRPVALGGLWKGETLDEKDIDDARKKMWQNFGEKEL